MGQRVSNERLEYLRNKKLTDVLDFLGLYWKLDREYKPVKTKTSFRIFVQKGYETKELLITGIRWYDVRERKGGGGAIDLVMHLYSDSFLQSIKRLENLK